MAMPVEDAVATKLHARVVEFIAKPEKASVWQTSGFYRHSG
jgi:hypothetical protein